MPHFTITRPEGDYGGETVHALVSGHTLTLKRGESATIPLDEDTEAHFLRDLRNRYDVQPATDPERGEIPVDDIIEPQLEIDKEADAQHAAGQDNPEDAHADGHDPAANNELTHDDDEEGA